MHPIMFLSKIVISTCHVYACKCGGEPYHIVKSSKMELSSYLKWAKMLFFFLFRAGLFFQLLSELCFPTWLFAFSKVCFKLNEYVIIHTHTLPRCGCSYCFHRLCNYYCIFNAYQWFVTTAPTPPPADGDRRGIEGLIYGAVTFFVPRSDR